MTNPLYPNSKSTGVMGAYEQAAFMDDTKQTIEKLDTLEFKPTKSAAQTQNLDRLELKGKKQQFKKKPDTLETVKALFCLASFIANPIYGLVAAAALYSVPKK